MKIGIITFHRTSNFGSTLQAFALCKAIRNAGYKCEIIDYSCEEVERRENLKIDISSVRMLAKYVLIGRKNIKKGKNLYKFLNSNEMISSQHYTTNNIKHSNREYDIFMIGSDIVWDFSITGNDLTFFLDFVDLNHKRIAFSSSVGNSPDFTGNMWQRACEELSKFKFIAMREKNSSTCFSQKLNKQISWVCDPTMLLPIEDWDRICATRKKKEKYVLVYFPYGSSFEDAKEYANRINAKILYINNGLPYKKVQNIKVERIEDFLALIKFAECIFTGSYHGLLFSIYFKKKFWFYNRAHSERMTSIADYLGVANRNRGEYELSFENINYEKVNKKISEFRMQSMELLTNSIESTKEKIYYE